MGRTHAEWTPGLLEQVWRIKRGLPATPKHGLLAQAERAKRGVPKTSKEGLLAQVERKKRERLARGPTRPPRRRGWSLYPPWSLPPDWDDPSRLGYVSPEALYEMVYGPPKIREPRRPEARLAPTRDQISRAKSKRWIIIDGNRAKALKGATLSELAWAITGSASDYTELRFPRDPKTLAEGESVDITPLLRKAAREPVMRKTRDLRLSAKGSQFIRDYEHVRLKPYDDQTGKPITKWKEGATIGYGHKFPGEDWPKFKDGISQEQANRMFDRRDH